MTFLSYPVLSCKKPSRLAQLGLALGLLVAFSVQADSARTPWVVNGHYYQRFDIDAGEALWAETQIACQAKGAHLATITSEGEQTMVYRLVSGAPVYGRFALGASDAAREGTWQWITGESFGMSAYTHWDSWSPNTESDSGDYLAMWFNDNPELSSYWSEIRDSTAELVGYICEWDANTYVGSTRVPDQNGNGYPEDAILYMDSKTGLHTVLISDRKLPNTRLDQKLTFAKNFTPPKGLGVLADTNGNNKPEIAVLDTDYTAKIPVVRIKDINNNAQYVRSIGFFNKANLYTPVSLSVEPDANKNGSFELTVTAQNKTTGKAYTETRDSKTGALLYSNAF